ncbi:hypothetical protein ABZU32_23940 [Sphaerisporangium sp. NPDC005288]|uniref:hypothetical protein n=1 Tax=Sphaerisporangium sp. NPDC005288 TaxID=3155114 RepID=UPI0033B12E23
MFVEFGPVKHRHKALLFVVLTPFLLTGCTSDEGPTAAEAGRTLRNHVLQLLKERDALNVKIVDVGGRNLPCGDGRVKQTFAATGTDVDGETSPYVLRTAMIGALGRVGHYKIVGSPEANKAVRVTDSSSKTVLLIDSPADGKYSIAGETECLRIS